MAILIRFVLFCWILIFAYLVLKYIFNPKRKLELAQQNGELFLLDNSNNVRENLLLTSKGVLFEGEKYMGTADDAFRIIHIKMSPHQKDALNGFSKDDFLEIEHKIFEQYPYATIEWTSPIKELLRD
ncbi:hypothetical protein [Caldalkalibacillus mannanilyticus]|uniref:hypothetical protein n=1 Tax=Caldalkalibacillus mannanilyticus TaxID=1418 RepID=UPI00046AD9D2|nr:hypothetical protein [Caldalkalibacillus mannanilyticus]